MNIEFIEACAKILTGQTVRVRIQRPAVRDYIAMVSKMNGINYLDFGMIPDGDYAFEIFLHELGHIKAGHACESDMPLKPSNSVSRDTTWSKDRPAEKSAERFARQWLELAERLAPYGTFETRLGAIAEWTYKQQLHREKSKRVNNQKTIYIQRWK